MPGHANVRVVAGRLGSRQQNERGGESGRFVRALDQHTADAPALIRHVHGQVGQVRAVAEIRDGTGDADQLLRHTRRHNNVSTPEHAAYRLQVINRAPLGERRATQHVDELVHSEVRFELIEDVYVCHH